MKILLICGAGMSTSLLANKMQKEALTRNLDLTVSAKAVDDLENVVENYDVVLVGPQIKYKENYIKDVVTKKGKLYAIIPPTIYGMVDGKGALDLALKLFNK